MMLLGSELVKDQEAPHLLPFHVSRLVLKPGTGGLRLHLGLLGNVSLSPPLFNLFGSHNAMNMSGAKTAGCIGFGLMN